MKYRIQVAFHLIFYKLIRLTFLDRDSQFKQSSVLVCDFNLVGKYLYDLPNAKWIQGTWAGVDKLMPFIQKDKYIPYQITRFTGEHFGKIMGEYVLANIVNNERNLLDLRKYQEKKEWNQDGKISNYRIISDLTVGILGLGNIGSRSNKISPRKNSTKQKF